MIRKTEISIKHGVIVLIEPRVFTIDLQRECDMLYIKLILIRNLFTSPINAGMPTTFQTPQNVTYELLINYN